MYDTPESITELGEINPELAKITANLPGLDLMANLPAFRSMMRSRTDASLADLGPAPPGIKESKISIPLRDGTSSVTLVTQPATGENHPLIVLYFGGGWFMGWNDQLTAYMRAFTEIFSAVVFAPTYRLIPENKFPIPITDGWDTLVYVVQNYRDFNASPEAGFIVGGISAGATITGIITQKYVLENLEPKITGTWSCIPLMFPDEEGTTVPEKYKHLWLSRTQLAEGMGLNKRSLDRIWAWGEPDFQSSWMTPFSPSTNVFDRQPRTYIQVCGRDPIRDDGLIYEKVLRDNGVETKLDVYPGLSHGFWVLFNKLAEAQKYGVDVVKGMGWLLGKEDVEGAVTINGLS